MQPVGENSTANIPAFLGKLWKMVNDPSTDHLICWSLAGNSFVIQNQAQFWYELLPLYYKHNNMSSFVRQLNMYGFHKISTVENGSMDSDKDEIQFFHPYFQKDQPEILKNIKRKVTSSKTHESTQAAVKHDDISKVLTDVRQLRGRQSSVDSQLTAMKQENAVLWREIALLRQKHLKQQQIVDKLIQFLVTLVQPTASARMGVGVKRRMPLMLHESPNKKLKGHKQSISRSQDTGPTIHELDSEIEITPEELLDEELAEDQIPMISSPLTPATSFSSSSSTSSGPRHRRNSMSPLDSGLTDDGSQHSSIDPEFLWDKPDFVNIDQVEDTPELPAEHLIETLQKTAEQASEKVFLNPATQNTLLSNLIGNGTYNSTALNGKNSTNSFASNNKNKTKKVNNKASTTNNNIPISNVQPNGNMQVATRNSNVKISNGDDLGSHLENTQSELDQLRDVLNGCNTFDANALLGLFNEAPDYGLPNFDKTGGTMETGDPMVSGNELATCMNNLIDFTELFDDSLDGHDNNPTIPHADLMQPSGLNTPECGLIDTSTNIKDEPLYPSFS